MGLEHALPIKDHHTQGQREYISPGGGLLTAPRRDRVLWPGLAKVALTAEASCINTKIHNVLELAPQCTSSQKHYVLSPHTAREPIPLRSLGLESPLSAVFVEGCRQSMQPIGIASASRLTRTPVIYAVYVSAVPPSKHH